MVQERLNAAMHGQTTTTATVRPVHVFGESLYGIQLHTHILCASKLTDKPPAALFEYMHQNTQPLLAMT